MRSWLDSLPNWYLGRRKIFCRKTREITHNSRSSSYHLRNASWGPQGFVLVESCTPTFFIKILLEQDVERVWTWIRYRDYNRKFTPAYNGFCSSIGRQVWNNKRNFLRRLSNRLKMEVNALETVDIWKLCVGRSILYFCCVVLRPGFEPGICDSKGHNAWPYCAAGINQLLHHRSNRQVIQILGHKIFSWSEKNEKFHNHYCHPQTRNSKSDSRGIGFRSIDGTLICGLGIW